MLCPKCKHAVFTSAKSCPKCGSQLPDQASPDRSAAGVDDIDSTLANLDKEIEALSASADSAIRDILGQQETHKSGTIATPLGKRMVQTQRPGVHAMADLNRYDFLKYLDEGFKKEFEIDRFPYGSLDYPTQYCETLDEFVEVLVDFLALSQSIKQHEKLREMGEAIRDAIRGGGMYGLNLPGRGCFINGWLLAQQAGCAQPLDALNVPGTFISAVSTVVHEKHGHGFISEFTESGRGKSAVYMDTLDLAQEFDLRPADSPDWRLLMDKWNLLFHTSMFTEEGFATWIEQHRLAELAQQMPDMFENEPRRYLPDDVINAMAECVDGSDGRERETLQAATDALVSLLRPEAPDVAAVQAAIAVLRECEAHLCVSGAYLDHFTQSPRYVFGGAILNSLANRLGTSCVPYAIAVACNVDFKLDTIANADLRDLVLDERDLTFNVDARLGLIASVELQEKDDLQELCYVCREGLNLAVPDFKL